MLTIANARRMGQPGVGPEADVWSLGCLLYELVTGDMLFYDPDWIRFFIRLTQPGQPLFPEHTIAAANKHPHLLPLLRYILVRDPRTRPTVAQVRARVEEVRKTLAREIASQRGDPGGAVDDGWGCQGARNSELGSTAAWPRVGEEGAEGGMGPSHPRAVEVADVVAPLPVHARRDGVVAAVGGGLLIGHIGCLSHALSPGRQPRGVVVLAPAAMAFGSEAHARVARAVLECAAAGVPCDVVDVPISAQDASRPFAALHAREMVSVALMPMLVATNVALRHLSAFLGPYPLDQAADSELDTSGREKITPTSVTERSQSRLSRRGRGGGGEVLLLWMQDSDVSELISKRVDGRGAQRVAPRKWACSAPCTIPSLIPHLPPHTGCGRLSPTPSAFPPSLKRRAHAGSSDGGLDRPPRPHLWLHAVRGPPPRPVQLPPELADTGAHAAPPSLEGAAAGPRFTLAAAWGRHLRVRGVEGDGRRPAQAQGTDALQQQR